MPPKKKNDIKTAKAEAVKASKAEPKSASKGKKADPVPPPAPKATNKRAKDPSPEPVAKGKAGRGKKDAAVVDTPLTPADPPKDEPKIVKVVTKGGAAVDSKVPGLSNYRVFQEAGKNYSATLNQANMDANNNKFYIVQILLN